MIGASLSDVGGVNGAGAAHLRYGGTTGLDTPNDRLFTLADLPGGVPTVNGQFAAQVEVGRLRSGRYSLVIASQREPVNGLPMAGAAWVVHTTSLLGTFNAATAERWTASNRLGVGPAQADSGSAPRSRSATSTMTDCLISWSVCRIATTHQTRTRAAFR